MGRWFPQPDLLITPVSLWASLIPKGCLLLKQTSLPVLPCGGLHSFSRVTSKKNTQEGMIWWVWGVRERDLGAYKTHREHRIYWAVLQIRDGAPMSDAGLYEVTLVRCHSDMENCLPFQWLKNKSVMDLASLSCSVEGHRAQNLYSAEHGTLSFRPHCTDWIPLRWKLEEGLLCSSFKKKWE